MNEGGQIWSGHPLQHFEFVGGDDKDPANLPRVPLFYYTHKRFLEHHKEKEDGKVKVLAKGTGPGTAWIT